MPSTERTPKVISGEVLPKVGSINKEVPVKNVVSEIGRKVEVPVSWDSACRV